MTTKSFKNASLVVALAILAAGLALCFTSTGRSAPPEAGPSFVPNEILVKFRPGVSSGVVTDIMVKHAVSAQAGLTTVHLW